MDTQTHSHKPHALIRRLPAVRPAYLPLKEADAFVSTRQKEFPTFAKRWKQPKCSPTGDWANKMCCVHTMEYYSALKGNSDTCYSRDELKRLS